MQYGTAIHYATERAFTVYWHMRRPAPNLEQEWLKRVANNLISRHKIRRIVKFISENRNLFDLPSPKLFSELIQKTPNDQNYSPPPKKAKEN
uniref:Uncharacterized protein n=1 Tax=Araneus ventricosus TaxID=182803 RepID=A0A4Y1ZQA9_ARAVE|nr:hypothetical protein AVEN_223535-1 [Araneus ventricosus]